MEILLNPIKNARVYSLNEEVSSQFSNKEYVIFTERLLLDGDFEKMLDLESIYYSSDKKFALTMKGIDFANYYHYVKMSMFQDLNSSYASYLYVEMLMKNRIDGFKPTERRLITPDFKREKIVSFDIIDRELRIDVIFNQENARTLGAEPTIIWGANDPDKSRISTAGLCGTINFIEIEGGTQND